MEEMRGSQMLPAVSLSAGDSAAIGLIFTARKNDRLTAPSQKAKNTQIHVYV
jgi:hypothetical protein